MSIIFIVKELPCLLSLNASQNQIEKIDIFDEADKLRYLQIANLSQNQIKELPPILLPNLFSLDLSSNQIATAAAFTGHPRLKILDLSKNKLTKLTGLKSMPMLEELIIAENELPSLEGLEEMPALIKLDVRKNPVTKTLNNNRLPNFTSYQSYLLLKPLTSVKHNLKTWMKLKSSFDITV